MIEQQPINYKDVIDLGFERKNETDDVFFNEYGFKWFIVEMILTKHILASWDCNSRLVELLRVDDGKILGHMPIENLQHLKDMLAFYGKYTQPKVTAA